MVSYGNPLWMMKFDQLEQSVLNDKELMIDWFLNDAVKLGMDPEHALAKAKQYGYKPDDKPKPKAKRGRPPRRTIPNG